MNPFAIFYDLILKLVSPLFVFVVKKWKYKVYLFLAAAFSLFILVDVLFFHIIERMQHAGFDLMMRYRIFTPQPDNEIVIVDIDEASLAAMAREYGRWPWPRQVLGEFVEHLERQEPRAVVFDILFSDPDVYNPDSDAYFDAVVAETNNTFFPMLRLSEASDPLSQVKPAMIPGVTPIPGKAQENATIAVVLPHFPSILREGRLGLHNIYPDPDGVAREYLVYKNDYGWKIPSLPVRVVRELVYREPSSPSVLLNWRGRPFTYQTLSFADVFNDMLSQNKNRPQDEFTNKIVLIGSTAPSLFDIKATPMSRLHPGVEIMATAIDNLKRGDYLRSPEGRVLYPLLSLVMVWVIAIAFYRDTGAVYVDRMAGGSQFTLLAVSYASLNFSNIYINLTGPFTIGLAYYAVARLYAAASNRAVETSMLRASLEQEGELRAFLLLIRVGESDHRIKGRKLKQLHHRLEKSGTEPKSVGFSEEEEVAIGRQAAGNLLGAAPLVNDLKLQRYVNFVGRWVATQSERPQLKWHFGVIDSNDINAFAAPGGYIFVTKGLYRLLNNESELAGVLAHEVGHVVHKHHLKLLLQGRLMETGSKILVKKAGENEQIKNLIGNGAEIFARALDKDAEFEADRTAVVLAARAGYDAFGLPAVLQDIGRTAKDDSSVALLFKTHPHPEERLAQLDEAIGNRFDSFAAVTLKRRFYRLDAATKGKP